ncbi:MAG TPA: 2Fe-2S iron-sulfur cluster-binding protein [Steroidobacteraceae bacterium]|nr:2Fe-2S iron-sulfur cluster-binding protein [Steroidobacteraceae bacterium]
MLKFHPLKVLQVVPDAEDAIEIALEVPEALRAEYRGSSGQHVVVRAFLDGEEVRRTYSLVNLPGEWPLRIVPRVHAHGRLSRHLAEQVRAGDVLDVLPPNGSFTPRVAVQPGATYVALAAGCGITPVLPVLRSLLAGGATRVLVFYGNTGTARVMCLEELLALKDRHLGALSLHFLMSREPQEVELYNGRLDAAHLRRFAATLFAPQAVQEYFICGPGDMIESLSATLRELGVESGRIHAEHFVLAGASAEAAAVRAVPSAPATGEAEVSILMDGRRRSFTMKLEGETVLDGAARAGIELPFSCRAGVCSTCRTKVVRGEVAMAQNYALEDWEVEQGYVLACQSHVKRAPLELDYDER